MRTEENCTPVHEHKKQAIWAKKPIIQGQWFKESYKRKHNNQVEPMSHSQVVFCSQPDILVENLAFQELRFYSLDLQLHLELLQTQAGYALFCHPWILKGVTHPLKTPALNALPTAKGRYSNAWWKRSTSFRNWISIQPPMLERMLHLSFIEMKINKTTTQLSCTWISACWKLKQYENILYKRLMSCKQ